ncbi:hypothetical protein [Calidithermus chliarophilus]|uniref:hypothetical protein n=1 Tax=Calidithermus chliarophilus TaxID=52023 RepID=UPI00146FB2A2|nr:hypothetical protein [Calidithermus chliarophilus]
MTVVSRLAYNRETTLEATLQAVFLPKSVIAKLSLLRSTPVSPIALYNPVLSVRAGHLARACFLGERPVAWVSR